MRGVVSSVVKLAEVQIRGSFLYFASQAGREGGREEGTTGGGHGCIFFSKILIFPR